jgi:hypothetical protein
MKNQSIIILLSSVLILASCGQGKQTEAVSEESTTEINEALQVKLAAYFEVKDALVSDNSEKAQEAATAMIAETGSYGDVLNLYLKIIAEASDIEDQRAAFELLSLNMYALAKTDNAGITVYKQFCPMAFDDKGAFWLSSEKQVMNPYFGASMLRCGRVEETIN